MAGIIKCGSATCTKEGSFTCSRCKSVKYCSKGCQRSAWGEHKGICKVVCERPGCGRVTLSVTCDRCKKVLYCDEKCAGVDEDRHWKLKSCQSFEYNCSVTTLLTHCEEIADAYLSQRERANSQGILVVSLHQGWTHQIKAISTLSVGKELCCSWWSNPIDRWWKMFSFDLLDKKRASDAGDNDMIVLLPPVHSKPCLLIIKDGYTLIKSERLTTATDESPGTYKTTLKESIRSHLE